MSSRPDLREFDHTHGERRISFDNLLGGRALGLHGGNRSDWNAGLVKDRLAAKDTLHRSDYPLRFPKRLRSRSKLLSGARNIDDQVIVRSYGIGVRILVNCVEEPLAALGGQDRADSIPELEAQQVVVGQCPPFVFRKPTRDDPFVDCIVHRFHGDLADGS